MSMLPDHQTVEPVDEPFGCDEDFPRLVFPAPVLDPALRDGRGARPDTVHIAPKRRAA
jgi:hypothetical protein